MKKIIAYTLLLVSSLCIFSCQKEDQQRTSPELTQIFNEQELKDIEMLVSVVEDKLLKNSDTKDIDKAFQLFIKDNLENLPNKFDLFNYEEVEKLYNTIDKGTFNNIWSYIKGYNFVLKDSTREITMAYERKFMNYIELLGNKDPKLKEYINHIKTTGTSSNFLYPPLLTNYNQEKETLEAPTKFGDYNTRVYRAIDIITISDIVYHSRIENKKIREIREKNAEREK
ncbi:hypothetical protein [uncultured Kordia sp.]|uniref:hypothetical protein n=1 Tax=uncultured Kordia sp. TaxID=507699 RepID=UPI002639474F|nr:hypothetical protein [uncultured Kordia sp.]